MLDQDILIDLLLDCDLILPHRLSPRNFGSFFANVISGWTVTNSLIKTNQSTEANCKASDLQIAKLGTNFAMEHKMGLVKISMTSQTDIPNRYYLKGETDYIWTANTTTVQSSESFSGNTPYKKDNGHYFIAQPGTTSFATSSTVSGYDSNLTSVNNSWSSGDITVTEGNVSNYTASISTFSYMTNIEHTLLVGDILYQNGELSHQTGTNGTLYTNRVPIGIVFTKTGTSNWTHGCAVAYQNSSNGASWGPTNTNPTGSTLVGPSALVNDKAGYTKTQSIKTSTYPAGYSAVNYVVKDKNNNSANPTVGTSKKQMSGWFLPSSGQWFEIIKNLGNMTLGYTQVYGNDTYICWEITNASQVTTTVNNINAYFSQISGGGYTVNNISTTTGFYDGYWTSTETARVVYNAYRVTFNTNYNNGNYKGYMAIQYNDGNGSAQVNKSETLKVRPIIAF